ncbi:TraB/GumN family protein [bacterium]|nr:TraB/GumN family protein [bacterium]MBP5591482.1 TraB/GumN family protein [bacterium]
MSVVSSIENPKTNLNKITFDDGKVLYLIGTAHVSGDSVKFVEECINEFEPDTVAVELDKNRMDVLKNRKKYEETDIIDIFKKKKVLFFTVQLIMSGYQKKIAEKTGSAPGSEFKKAIELAEEKDLKLVNADRDISVTLKRTINSMTFKEKVKFFTGMLFGDDKDVDEKAIEELKKGDMLMQIIGEMQDEFPSLKRTILDERDRYLAANIAQNLGEKTVAVVGAAHVPGILRRLQEEKPEEDSLDDINFVPKGSKVTKIIPWIIPLLIIGMFIYGFFNGNAPDTLEAAIWWVVINGTLSALGCALALGHPLTILAGFIAAPITSLNPTIGAGIVTGLVQLYLVRPRVIDLETVSQDTMHLKGWWKNKLSRTLLVSLFSSIGSAIGTFAAIPFLMKLLM